ncbi:GNAT family N-acetyltransferase [Rivihabitans pingtungensis]|uniref:GNAT family N-acetyltransferase n=1 Tax=Rivihabitans pingtungensis TaxID=1054498 RepID=UPI0023EFDFE0|nr:GNAT family N-acetyltransferase [Rivihabitans pingtungensis]
MKVQVQSLSSIHNRKNFDCGQAQLNNWLATMAGQQQEKNIARTFVAVNPGDPATILGFYTLTVSDVDGSNCPSHNWLPNRVPVVRLGRFATSINIQGKGLGSLLLQNALERIYEISAHAGVAAVVVDAKDQKAADFYKNRGFLPSPNNSLCLFLFTHTLRQAIGGSKALL